MRNCESIAGFSKDSVEIPSMAKSGNGKTAMSSQIAFLHTYYL